MRSGPLNSDVWRLPARLARHLGPKIAGLGAIYMNVAILVRSVTGLLITLGLSLVTAGCDVQQARAKRTISHDLVDPGSAQWRDVGIVKRMTSDGGAISTVCGQVNSRNRLGGMAGFSRFAFVTQHKYPSALPAGGAHVLPPGVYDMDDMPDDNLALRRNLSLDPFPRSDERGDLTMTALCINSPSALPSSLIDYTWVNPCEGSSEGADSLYRYSNAGGVGSDNWIMSKVIQKFAGVPKKNVCRVLLSNYRRWTPLIDDNSDASYPPYGDPRASEILSEAVTLANTARRMSEGHF